MKYIILLLVALFVVSCSDNPVNSPSTGNPPVSGDSLIFSVDSIVFRTSNQLAFHWSNELPVVDSLKFQFTGETNVDSLNSLVFAVTLYLWNKPTQAPNPQNYWQTHNPYTFNNPHTVYFANPYDTLYSHSEFHIGHLNSQPKYIILKNVKIYKVRPQ